MMIKLSDKSVALLRQSKHKELWRMPEIIGFWEALGEKYPRTVETYVYTPEHMFDCASVVKEMNLRYWGEIQSRVHFMRATMFAKTEMLLDGLVYSINERNTTVMFIVIRQIMEHVSANWYFSNGVIATWRTINMQLRESIGDCPILSKELEDRVIGYSYCSLFNWDAYEESGSLDFKAKWALSRDEQVKAGRFVNVLNCVDAVSKSLLEKEGLNWRMYYDLICDFVHPNRGGNEALCFPKAGPKDPKYLTHVLVRRGALSPEEEQLWLTRLDEFGALPLLRAINLQYGLCRELNEVKFIPE